jgi:hypothetical protein
MLQHRAEPLLGLRHNLVGVLIAAGALPFFGILLSPTPPAAAELRPVSVIANALRLSRAAR